MTRENIYEVGMNFALVGAIEAKRCVKEGNFELCKVEKIVENNGEKEIFLRGLSTNRIVKNMKIKDCELIFYEVEFKEENTIKIDQEHNKYSIPYKVIPLDQIQIWLESGIESLEVKLDKMKNKLEEVLEAL